MSKNPLIVRTSLLLACVVFAVAVFTGDTMLAGTNDPKAAQPSVATVPHKALLDLNKASIYDLESLPGIGGAEAHKIIDNRPYRTKADLLSRKVLPEATYKQIAPLVMINIHKVSGKPNC